MTRWLIAVLSIILLSSACGPLQPSLVNPTPGSSEKVTVFTSKYTPAPRMSATLPLAKAPTSSVPAYLPTSTNIPSTFTPTPAYASLGCNGMTPSPKEGVNPSNQILYYEYEYFQLEGIPPYSSPYVKMVASDQYWVDMADPNRSRFERYYHTQTSGPKEGFERIDTGTGTGGVFEDCQFYEGTEECSQKPITRTLTVDDWFQFQSSMANKFLANKNTPESNAGYAFKGCQADEMWGEAYVFERTVPLTTSDLYKNYPSTEIQKFDVAMKRAIEWKRTVMDGEKVIVHDFYRLIKWEMLDRTSVPQELFALH